MDPISDVVLLGLVNLGFTVADLAARRAAGQVITPDQLAALKTETVRVMDEAHRVVEADRARSAGQP